MRVNKEILVDSGLGPNSCPGFKLANLIVFLILTDIYYKIRKLDK